MRRRFDKAAGARRLELLERIGTRALAGTDIDAFLVETARDACRLLSLPRCAIRLPGDPEKVVEHVEPGFGPPSPDPGPLRRGTGPGSPGPVVRAAVEVGDGEIGTLSLDHGGRRTCTDDDAAAARAVARQIALAVRHRRLLQVEEENRRLHARLLLGKKFEAVAALAGGIAHDFNNLLAVVLGRADLLLHASEPGSEAWTAACAIQRAADRASQLTSQLLGFARRGKNLEVPVDLRRTAEAIAKEFAAATDGRIAVLTRFHEGSAAVVGDPRQLEGAIGHVAANAIDAMPAGGTLTISTEDAVLDEAFCRSRPGASPGRYVLLKVADTGVGIPGENLGRVFDPFFSTKERGTGTGLGLSMVYGVVKSHGGYIEVESEPGAGATFLIFLPRAAVDARQLEIPYPVAPPDGAGRAKSAVLLVDDQEMVREVCGAMLRILGYDVLTASDGAEALERYRGSWRDIDVVILDMVMPNVDGPACFRGMKAINPGVRAILSSGFSLEGSVQELMDEGVAAFIPKPFRMEELSRAIARALGRPS